MSKIAILFLAATSFFTLHAQTYKGSTQTSEGEALPFVSIGIVGKDIGTVSDMDGKYSLKIGAEYDNDTIRFSYIGYTPLSMSVAQFKAADNSTTVLHQRETHLKEITINPRKMVEKTLGNQYTTRLTQAGFKDNKEGYELGVLLDIKKPTLLQSMHCNISRCTYDSIYYRLNIYKETDNDFESILQKPIYVAQKVDSAQHTITVDLSPYNITVDHNTLLSLEYIKDMGEGTVVFPAKFNMFKGKECYSRKTSQGEWQKIPVKLAFYVKVKEEQ